MSSSGIFQSSSVADPGTKPTAAAVRDALVIGARELAERTYAKWAKKEFRDAVSHVMEIGLKTSDGYVLEDGDVVRFAHHSITLDLDQEDLPELLEAMVLQFAAAVTSSVAIHKKVELLDALEATIQDRPSNYFTFSLKQRYAAAL